MGNKINMGGYTVEQLTWSDMLPETQPERKTTATWVLVKKSVEFIRALPAEVRFTADVYACSNCNNMTNNRTELQEVCPWCGSVMAKGGDDTWNN